MTAPVPVNALGTSVGAVGGSCAMQFWRSCSFGVGFHFVCMSVGICSCRHVSRVYVRLSVRMDVLRPSCHTTLPHGSLFNLQNWPTTSFEALVRFPATSESVVANTAKRLHECVHVWKSVRTGVLECTDRWMQNVYRVFACAFQYIL